MALEPIETTDDQGNTVKTDLDAVGDGVIATKAMELHKQVMGEQLQQATNEFTQGVRIAGGVDVDAAVDVATAESVKRAERAAEERDRRLDLVSGDVTSGWAAATVEYLQGLARAWEQDYAGHRAHVKLAESDEQVKASTIAMIVIEGAHAALRAELDSRGTLEKDASTAVDRAKPRVEAFAELAAEPAKGDA